MRRLVAAAAIGSLLGAGAAVIWQGREIDQLVWRLSTLTIQYDAMWHENTQLTGLLRQANRDPVIHGVRVNVRVANGANEVKVAQFVAQQLNFLIGRKLTILQEQPDLLVRLLDGRTLTIDDKPYTLRVNAIVISETLYVVVTTIPRAAT